MAREVVLDANVIVAQLDGGDILFDRARALGKRLREEGALLVILDVALSEPVSVLCRRAREHGHGLRIGRPFGRRRDSGALAALPEAAGVQGTGGSWGAGGTAGAGVGGAAVGDAHALVARCYFDACDSAALQASGVAV